MRNYDFTPLWRSTVGFDRTFDLLNNSQVLDGQDNYPPYDIARTGEESYRISLAIAGFSPDEIAITAHHRGEIIKRDVSARLGVVEPPVGILLYDNGFFLLGGCGCVGFVEHCTSRWRCFCSAQRNTPAAPGASRLC